jgi:hypothetical protein
MPILLNRMTKNYFGSSNFEKIKSQTSFSFNFFYLELWIYWRMAPAMDGLDSLWAFDASGFGSLMLRHFGTLATLGTSTLQAPWDFGHFSTLDFRPSWNSRTSYFKAPEAHFPKHLDWMRPIPFNIYDSCFCFGTSNFSLRYTWCNFEILNTQETLIWNPHGISTIENITYLLLVFPARNRLPWKLHLVCMVAA